MKMPAWLVSVTVLLAGCGDPYAGANALQAEKAQLERELEGLQTVMVRDTPVQVGVKAEGLLITTNMIWLGADVTLDTLPVTVPAPGRSGTRGGA